MVFSGTAVECLVHLGENIDGETSKLLAEFCEVTDGTVSRWLIGEYAAKGSAALRLRCFLSLMGYTVTEYAELPRPTRALAMMVSTGIVEIEDLQRELGYKVLNGVYDLILRGTRPMADRAFRIERLVSEKSDELTRAMSEWTGRITGSDSVEAPVLVAETAPATRSLKRTRVRSRRRSDVGKVDAVVVLSHLLLAFDNVLTGVDEDEKKRVVKHFGQSLSAKRLQRVQSLLGEALEG